MENRVQIPTMLSKDSWSHSEWSFGIAVLGFIIFLYAYSSYLLNEKNEITYIIAVRLPLISAMLSLKHDSKTDSEAKRFLEGEVE